jgi:hypothetical protein
MRKGVGMISVVVVAVLAGCGSGSGSGGTGGGGGGISGGGKGGGAGGSSGSGPFTTSVPGSTPLTGLSGGQQTQLCKDFTSYADSTLAPALCKFDGVLFAAFSGATTDADLQAACTTGYNSCLAADGGATVTCNPNAAPSTCTATVSDLTTCLDAEAVSVQQFPSCSSVTAATVATLFADGGTTSMEPAVCAQFQQGGSCASAVSMPGSGTSGP